MSKKNLFLFLSCFVFSLTSLASGSCDTLRIPLPNPSFDKEYDRDAFYRDGILYLFSTWVPEITNTVRDSDKELAVPCSRVPTTVQIAFINATSPKDGFDFNQFRNAVGEAYLQGRQTHHAQLVPPPTLAEIQQLTKFESWPVDIVTKSRVKGRTRAIYRSPKESPYTLTVSVTHETTDGNVNTPVRETELILRRDDDPKNWDFYVYDSTGRLVTQSHFVAPQAFASPSVCMNCHYSSGERAFVPVTSMLR